MQPTKMSDGTSREQPQELLRHIRPGLREAFDGCLSEPLPLQFEELIGLIHQRADGAKTASNELKQPRP
jgi:hypothetical protein